MMQNAESALYRHAGVQEFSECMYEKNRLETQRKIMHRKIEGMFNEREHFRQFSRSKGFQRRCRNHVHDNQRRKRLRLVRRDSACWRRPFTCATTPCLPASAAPPAAAFPAAAAASAASAAAIIGSTAAAAPALPAPVLPELGLPAPALT
ncbi:hypothetical protein BC829DRAFT_401141 [Chytridium lagenaria]|nr:hypothetical protein BC829DRAFT_401141 [Chytridium lagenaria]